MAEKGKADGFGEFLDPTAGVTEVPVGDQTLVLRRLTFHRSRGFWTGIGAIDFEPAAESVARVITGDLAQAPAAIRKVLMLLGTDGVDGSLGACAAALDCEENYKRLRKAGCLGEDPAAPVRKDGHYVGSDALRTWVEFSMEVPQAINVLREALARNAYGELGKAALARMTTTAEKMTSRLATVASGPSASEPPSDEGTTPETAGEIG